ncbi:PepSY domain-containing protein [Dokdonella soli]|uniref:PepSY domain-containing protein n=1 Tax=Dokdonella soli TaxID=529810 RepID=A0ABN1IH51_9GAMM
MSMPLPFKRLPLKRVLYRLHWLAGLIARLVLAVVGFTGGLLGFKEPILALLNPELHITAEGRSTSTPDQWIASARAAYPAHAIRGIALLMPLFAISGWWLWLARRNSARRDGAFARL